MLHMGLAWERKKNIMRDRLLTRMCKTIKVIFSCITSEWKLPGLDLEDYKEFFFLNEDRSVPLIS